MPTARLASSTGPIDLYYEETGQGFPLIWCHEYGGDYRSWEQQVRYFSRRYRVVTWNYRGYPPSEVPKDPAAYSVEILVEDLRGRGHRIVTVDDYNQFGSGQMIWRLDGGYLAASDPRRDGQAAGF